jgi:hypothetical protein
LVMMTVGCYMRANAPSSVWSCSTGEFLNITRYDAWF